MRSTQCSEPFGVVDRDAALLVRHPRRAETDDDLLLAVVEQVADRGRAVDRGARLLRPTREVVTGGAR